MRKNKEKTAPPKNGGADAPAVELKILLLIL